MNEPLVKGGQGRCASDLVSLSMLTTALVGLVLVGGITLAASLWTGPWSILTALGLLVLLATHLGIKADRRRMAREEAWRRVPCEPTTCTITNVNTDVTGARTATTTFSITHLPERLDVRA